MGGNVFGTTASIKREDIKPTLKEFFRETDQFDQIRTESFDATFPELTGLRDHATK